MSASPILCDFWFGNNDQLKTTGSLPKMLCLKRIQLMTIVGQLSCFFRFKIIGTCWLSLSQKRYSKSFISWVSVSLWHNSIMKYDRWRKPHEKKKTSLCLLLPTTKTYIVRIQMYIERKRDGMGCGPAFDMVQKEWHSCTTRKLKKILGDF